MPGSDAGGAYVFAVQYHEFIAGDCAEVIQQMKGRPRRGGAHALQQAAPQSRAPVQTEKTYVARTACSRMNERTAS